MSRRGLQVADLQALAARVRAAHRPAEIFAAVEALCADAIGQRLFTVMRFDAESFEVERLYTSDAAAYPVGGRKKKARDAWGEHVLVEARAFRANTPEEIRATSTITTKSSRSGSGRSSISLSCMASAAWGR